MEDLRNDPVRQESESHENADKNEQAPSGAQATGVGEESSHIVGSFRLRFFLFPVLGILIRKPIVGENRWDEKAGLRRDAVRSQVIDAL
jgi:hypothetical protein